MNLPDKKHLTNNPAAFINIDIAPMSEFISRKTFSISLSLVKSHRKKYSRFENICIYFASALNFFKGFLKCENVKLYALNKHFY